MAQRSVLYRHLRPHVRQFSRRTPNPPGPGKPDFRNGHRNQYFHHRRGFNAELGNNLETQTPGTEALGRFANSRVSTAGREWRQWAIEQGYKECSSRFQLRHRCTWKHPRFSTEHELDHFFIHHTHLWHLVSCRILQEGPNVDWPWSAYTDHNPVELTLRHGKMWGRNKRHNTIPSKPDVQKLRGPSAGAARNTSSHYCLTNCYKLRLVRDYPQHS